MSSVKPRVKLVVHTETKWAELVIDGFAVEGVLPFDELEVLED